MKLGGGGGGCFLNKGKELSVCLSDSGKCSVLIE